MERKDETMERDSINRQETKKFPDGFPPNTKKFVEVGSKEVLYITPNGEVYRQSPNNAISKLQSLKNLWSSPPNSKPTHKKSSMSESISTP